jgi:hypothetical protein
VASGLCISDKKDKKGFFWVIVVANYAPPGNLVGTYTNNVFPAEGGEKKTTKQTTTTPSENLVVSSTRNVDSSATKSKYSIAFAISTITFLMFIIIF